MEGMDGRGGRGEEKARLAAQGRSQNPVVVRCPPATDAIATCATPDLLLGHLDATLAAYI
jgi:hypothetical protein